MSGLNSVFRSNALSQLTQRVILTKCGYLKELVELFQICLTPFPVFSDATNRIAIGFQSWYVCMDGYKSQRVKTWGNAYKIINAEPTNATIKGLCYEKDHSNLLSIQHSNTIQLVWPCCIAMLLDLI